MLQNISDVECEYLLGRSVECHPELLVKSFDGCRICVTGAGGSIGSIVSSVLAENMTKGKLLLLDRHDGNLFGLGKRLEMHSHRCELRLCDVTDPVEINPAIMYFRPDYVIHCAAYKHVAMLQNQHAAATKNNVIGTMNTLNALAGTHHGKFVLISTDKAVEAFSVMGRTKKAAEDIVLEKTEVETAVVRFANVLGSSGSVYEIWKNAVESGRDILVRKGMERFFITFKEAASLILKACLDSDTGKIFVPSFAKPIDINLLATRFCDTHGGFISYGVPASGEKMTEKMYLPDEPVVLL